MTTTTTFAAPERLAPLTELSEGALGELRLREPDALRKLEQSLRRHGQLEPLTVFAEDGLLEVLDGFKRLHAARQLRWEVLRVRVAEVDGLQAKVLLLELHGRCGLSVLEEAFTASVKKWGSHTSVQLDSCSMKASMATRSSAGVFPSSSKG